MFDPLRRLLGPVPIHASLAAARAHFAGFDQRTPLADCDFVVVDCEMTGLNHRRDEIVSLGAVRIRTMVIEPGDSFYAVVRPQRVANVPRASTLIHRITPSEATAAPPLAEVLPEFARYLGTGLIVGHHIDLDMAFLNRASRDILGSALPNPCLDTLRLARMHEEAKWQSRSETLRTNYTLPELARNYGLPEFTAHHAMADALQTAYLFLFLARKLGQGRIRTLKDLYALGRSWRWYV